MGAQDNTERVLRKLHVLLSKSEPYSKDATKVIVDKEAMLGILTELNGCIYEIMEEYEITQRSHDKAEREFRKKGDDIVWNASRKAEDIYAASVMYTDEALNRVHEIMKNASASVQKIYKDMDEKLKEQEQAVKSNQLELKSQLQNLVDTEKYLSLIEQRNREIKKQEEEGKKATKSVSAETNIYADRSTGIKINEEYFEKMGYSVNNDQAEEENKEEKPAAKPDSKAEKPVEEKKATVIDVPNVSKFEEKEPISEEEERLRAELDADYFEWSEQEKAEPEEPTGSIKKVLEKLREKKIL